MVYMKIEFQIIHHHVSKNELVFFLIEGEERKLLGSLPTMREGLIGKIQKFCLPSLVIELIVENHFEKRSTIYSINKKNLESFLSQDERLIVDTGLTDIDRRLEEIRGDINKNTQRLTIETLTTYIYNIEQIHQSFLSKQAFVPFQSNGMGSFESDRLSAPIHY